jgi:hypothetical protein
MAEILRNNTGLSGEYVATPDFFVCTSEEEGAKSNNTRQGE